MTSSGDYGSFGASANTAPASNGIEHATAADEEAVRAAKGGGGERGRRSGGKDEAAAAAAGYRSYPDGAPRPLLRGCLHLVLAPLAAAAALGMLRAGDVRYELIAMLATKSASWVCSAYLHMVDHGSAPRYAAANAADFFLLPFNGGSVLAVATPRAQRALRALHAVVLAGIAAAVVRPVFTCTVAGCKKDAEASARARRQISALTVGCGLWVAVMWVAQAGFSKAWLGSVICMSIGFLFYNIELQGIEAPWHGVRWWRAHDDFHVFAALADVCVFAYAIPAASDLAGVPYRPGAWPAVW